MSERTLCVDQSEESREAEAVLREAGLKYGRVLIEDRTSDEGRPIPRLLTLEGIFESLSQIRWYAQAYGNGGRGG